MGWPDVGSDRFFIPFVQPLVDALLRKRPDDTGQRDAIQHVWNLP